jgi:hypothetical protein
MTISVSNSNLYNKPVFDNLSQIFNYKLSHSSKSNQYRITRGAQGDALKELGTIPYMLINSNGEGGQEKQWKYPLVFQHNQKVDKVYIKVDRKNRVIKHRIERSTCEDIDIKITITLPALDEDSYKSLKSFCLIYTLFNTHLSFKLTFEGYTQPSLLASLPMSEDYHNPNSIYCYSEIELQTF